MTRAVLAAVGAGTDRAPIELRGEDRLSAFAVPIRDASIAMVAFALGSLIFHGLLMALAVVAARPPLVVPPQREIAVEIVRDMPKAPPPKPESAKTEASKPEALKPEPLKPAQSNPRAAKAEQAKPPPPAAMKPAPAQKPAEADKLKAMQDELASLRAEQEALKAAQAQEASGKALALPSIGGGDGDAVGYQQLVFSQLAKAKGDSEYRGQAGTTAVKFEMDAAGKLVHVEIVRSSGKTGLDAQALDIIHRAAPFPPPPTAADRIVFANVNFVPPKTP